MEKDPFDVLGVQHGADTAVVTAAYKALCKKYHPDLNPDDKEAAKKMQEINDAYTAIKKGDYESEEYYHPERKAPEQGAQSTQSAFQNPGYQQYQTGYGNPYINVDPYLNNNPPQGPNDPGKGGKGKKVWYYNGVEMPLWKALLHQAWDRWLSQLLLYVLVPLLIIFILFKVFTGHGLGGEAKKSKDDIQKSLTQKEAMVALPESIPQITAPDGNTYDVILTR